jgi:hypothetical protein
VSSFGPEPRTSNGVDGFGGPFMLPTWFAVSPPGDRRRAAVVREHLAFMMTVVDDPAAGTVRGWLRAARAHTGWL